MTAAPPPAEGSATYREHVPATRWFGFVARLLFLAPVAGIVSIARDPDVGTTGRVLGIIVLVVAGLILLAVGRWFLALEVTVSAEALRFRFGPFGRTLGASALREAQVRQYPWLAFGGWGWRFGRLDGGSAQAYSVPFLREGVAVATTEGRTYYISSRTPQRLVEAIERLQHGAGAA